jgi:hypothetical protein
MKTVSRAALLGSLSLVACTFASPSAPEQSNEAAKAACRGYVAAGEANRARCYKESEREITETMVGACIARSQASGTGFDAGYMAACANALNAEATCVEQPERALVACYLPAGKHKTWEACSDNAVCASGFCDGAASKKCGRCQDPKEEGDVCSISQRNCRVGLVCASQGSSFTGVCRALHAEGEACTSGDNDCQHPSTCIGGTCRSAANRQQPCRYAAQCLGDLLCIGSTSTTLGKCSDARAIGSSCASDDDCVTNAKCGKGKCVERPEVGPGEACASARCTDGYSCQLINVSESILACAKVKKLGETCNANSSASCERGSFCINGECRLEQGSSCVE